MRILAGLVLAVSMLAPAARPALADNDIVLDDDAPSVQIKGTWASATATSGFLGNGYHYRVAGDGGNTFTWPFTAAPGRHEVSVRWTAGANRASNATYTIASTSGASTVSVDQRS